MKRCAILLLFAVGCGKGPSEGQCKSLLDHLVDLEFKKAGAGPAGANEQVKTDLAKQKAAVIEAKQAEFMGICKDKTSKVRVECALAATDLDGIAKCDTN